MASFFTCQVKNWYIVLFKKSQHFRTRIDCSKTAGAQLLRAEWKAVGSGAASRAAGGGGALPTAPFPSHPSGLWPAPYCLPACLGQPTPSCYLSDPPGRNSPGRPWVVHGGQAFPPSFEPRRAPARYHKSRYFKLGFANWTTFPGNHCGSRSSRPRVSESAGMLGNGVQK